MRLIDGKRKQTQYTTQVRDVAIYGDDVVPYDVYELKYERKKVDEGGEVYRELDELAMRDELINRCKFDEQYFGKKFFICKDQERFNLKYMDTFKLDITQEQQALLLQAFTFVANGELFPKEFGQTRSREIQVLFLAVKLDMKAKKNFKFGKDAQLLGAAGKVLNDLTSLKGEINLQVANGVLELPCGQIAKITDLFVKGQKIPGTEAATEARLLNDVLAVGAEKHHIQDITDANGNRVFKDHNVKNNELHSVTGNVIGKLADMQY